MAYKLLSAMGTLALGTPAVYAVNAAWNTDAATGDFGFPNWTSGVTVPAAGGTYSVVSGDALYFGTSTTTTLNNDLTGATFAGLTFNSGASAFTIGGNSFTLTGNITNSSTSTQTINNDIVISGARQFNANSGQLVLGGNITGNTGGSWTLNATNKITLSGTNNLTLNTNYGGLLINPTGGDASAGGVDITGSTTINGAAGNIQSGYVNIAGTVTLAIKSGGSLTINPTTNSNSPGGIIGQNKTGTSTISVESGGSLTFGGNQGLAFGNNRSDAIGVLDVSGTATIAAGSTTATDTRSFVALGRDSGTGTVNLNTGGVLATGRNFIRDGSATADTVGAGNFNFMGGTLKALANQTDWLNSATINTNQLAMTSVTTTSAASTIDANGFTVGINNNITGNGGFHIVDSSATSGVVNFGGSTYSYTGTTSVDSGTLTSNAASVTLAGALAVNGGTLSLNGSGAGTLALGANPFTMTLGTISYSLGDQITGSGSFNITGGMLDLTNSISDYGVTYTFLSGFASGSVSGLSITNYDSLNYIAALSDTGVLSFSAIPEPSTYAGLAGLVALGVVAYRRRRRA